jgi:type II secretory pathway component GspD/PulD (secretin)
MPPEGLKKVCAAYQTDKGCRLGTQFLTPVEMRRLLQSVQDDRHSSVLQSPKITMANGQTALLEVSDFETLATTLEIEQMAAKLVATPTREKVCAGLKVGLESVVSADRKSVHLLLNANVAELSPPAQVVHAFQRPALTKMTVKVSADVPDGRTLLVSGWDSIRQGRVMSHILFATPRIIINASEAEEKREELPVPPHE